MPSGRLQTRGVPGTSHQEETQGTAQNTLEGLCLLAGLGTPWAPPGGAGGGVWGEGRLGVSAESAGPATWSWVKQKTMSTSTSTVLQHQEELADGWDAWISAMAMMGLLENAAEV
ncbi:hypothetical protein ILYODFUR_009219 [Ilyodon furcidens]|uniref:Uncharacterized protein n=1 Tax=Ilyodon furcidens TaxID=33524 RepID=A0ABV0TH78_9TELE